MKRYAIDSRMTIQKAGFLGYYARLGSQGIKRWGMTAQSAASRRQRRFNRLERRAARRNVRKHADLQRRFNKQEWNSFDGG